MTLVQVRLARDSLTTPWGFRLQGGKDLNQALTVQRVFANTPSERELQRGDILLAINGRDTTNLSHKQAQDAISRGGGQIELLVSRPPPGQVYIKPLSPTKDTRAPSFPQVPTKAPQIVIPIQRKTGPTSPSRIIPISPQKPPPSHSLSTQPKPRQMAAAGHMPKKVTLNKYGGGTVNFGYGPTSPPAHVAKPSYRPVAAPVPAYDQRDYAPPSSANYTSGPAHPEFAPSQPAEEKGVLEEEYGGVSERRKQFLKGGPNKPTVHRSNRPPPTFSRPPPGSEVTFGVDYGRPQPKPVQPSKPSQPRKQRPPPVNRLPEDEVEGSTPWSNTLKSEGRMLKPWEIEAMEAERYQQGTADQPYRPSMAPATAPKPKITQISSPAAQQSGGQQQKPPGQLGDRDWSNSYVYQMVHQSKTSTQQSEPGKPPETVTTTQTVHETKFPGQEPQRTVTESVQHGRVPDYTFDNSIGLSDF